LRIVTTRLPAKTLESVREGLGVLGGIPLVNQTVNKFANFWRYPDLTVRICDNFDWYAPRFQSHHSIDELRRWFSEEGYADITALPPAKNGGLYRWKYENSIIIGSGANMSGRKE
jgi:hypothetical protein